jgi:type IV pilus assembly protein PilM
MPTAKTVWGIDVGQCALKAIRLRWRDNRLQAVGFDVIEHSKVLSQPDADEQQLIRHALKKFLDRNSIKGSTIVVSVPGQASFTRFIKLPPVEQRKVPEIVRYEARQQIPFNLEDVVWDYQTLSPAGAGPREVEVGIFAMKREIVADYVADFLAMRIEPDIVQMAPVALYNFLMYDKQGGGGATILVDVGAENTNLVIADADRVWIRPVPIGGNNFTQALCKQFKLPFAKAENLKRHAAESKHARKVFQAMRPVFGDLLTEVQRSIGYYTSLHRDSRIERVVALGNAFRLPGLRNFLAQSLGLEVEAMEGFHSLPDAPALNAPLFRENVLSFGVAFGLAVQGLGRATIQTSLLPPEILSQKIMRKKRPFFAGAAACLVAAIGCFGYDQIKGFGELAGQPGEVDRMERDVGQMAEENTAKQTLFEKEKQALVERQTKLAELEGIASDPAYAYELAQAVWEALPYDERWRTYDPAKNSPPRTDLRQVELLDLKAQYVADVRPYSGSASEGLDKIEVIEAGAEPAAAPAEAPAGGGSAAAAPQGARGPRPGILIRIVGITPKPARDGQQFINDELIEKLKNNPRTVRLRTPAGEEMLAKVRLTGRFGDQREFADFSSTRSGARGVDEAVAGPPVVEIDRRNDSWFVAEWVVKMPDRGSAPAAPAETATEEAPL